MTAGMVEGVWQDCTLSSSTDLWVGRASGGMKRLAQRWMKESPALWMKAWGQKIPSRVIDSRGEANAFRRASGRRKGFARMLRYPRGFRWDDSPVPHVPTWGELVFGPVYLGFEGSYAAEV
jgi:hypothetical protein